MPDEKLPDDVLWHQSGVNPRGEPFVQLLRGDQVIAQMSVEQARDHGHAILEAAEAAEQDAFLLHFARTVLGCDEQTAAQVLLAFRNYRAGTTGKRGGPTNPRDWVMPPPDRTAKYDPPDFTQRNPGKRTETGSPE